MKKSDVIEKIKNKEVRSAWANGVRAYAVDILENRCDLDELPKDRNGLEKELLNGASDWSEYSWGGCALIYDRDIAERLCNKTELKKTDHGRKAPNAREEWLDTQARALHQAASLIINIVRFPDEDF